MTTLAANITATDRRCYVEGSVAGVTQGFRFRLDDEILEFRGYEVTVSDDVWKRHTGWDDHHWIIRRGVDGSVAASHSAGITLAAVTDAATSEPGLVPPDPFPSATGSVTDHVAEPDPHTGYLKESVVSGFGTPAVVLGTAAAAGSATTGVRTDATLAAFDATVPTTQAFGDAAAAGAAAVAARRDHKHGMPAEGVAISALPPVVTPAATDEFVVNQGGTSKKVAWSQIAPLDLFIGSMDPRLCVANATPGINNACFAAFQVHRPVTVTKARCVPRVQNGNVDLGIYTAAGALLGSTGSTAVGTVDTMQEINLTASVSLLPGVKYWAALATDSATASFWQLAATAFGVVSGITWVRATSFPLTGPYTPSATATARHYGVWFA